MQRHITDRVDFSKFGVPSWRIEQRYAPGVLIGNWSEERLAFPKGKYQHNSTNRVDFKNYGSVEPDVLLRRKAKLGSEGIPADMLFRHHGRAYDNMMITLYDENYNGRWKERDMPHLRSWDGQKLGWLPERTDHPLRGPPTNFGLKEHVEAQQLARQQEMNRPDFESTYSGSYKDQPLDSMRFTRYATPKHLSTTLLPSNKSNNDLHLRGKPNLRLPEIMPAELTQISV
ncbi:uncharacterized protein C1orf158 [Aplysia californica]|uniref:Uncharacterized protein C1orf158 n=1 Tax=Aplysia californica TaxID=6500 RepID=A0ABM0K8J2_APLCA|nr:uncharacterized protein C1orf158 [Aplysia californica]